MGMLYLYWVNTKTLSQDGRCRGRDLKATPPEYKYKALPPKQPVQSHVAEVLLRNRYLLNSATNFLFLYKNPHISYVYFTLRFIFLIPHTQIWPFQASKTLKYTKLGT